MDKKKVKELKAKYSFAASEMDRYASSVFYVPGGAREQKYEAEMKAASDELKKMGILY